MNGQNRPLIKPKRRLVINTFTFWIRIVFNNVVLSHHRGGKEQAVQIVKRLQQLYGGEIKMVNLCVMPVESTSSYMGYVNYLPLCMLLS